MMERYVRTTESEAVEFDQEWIILHADRFTVTKVNETGGLCWSLLKQPQTIHSLALSLAEQYDITPEQASQDVEHFVRHMMKIGLVRHAG